MAVRGGPGLFQPQAWGAIPEGQREAMGTRELCREAGERGFPAQVFLRPQARCTCQGLDGLEMLDVVA